jgi:hypothetical protein
MGDTLEALIVSCQKEGRWFNLYFYPGKSRLKWVATTSIHPTNCKTLELETGWRECTEQEKQMEGSGKTPEIAVSRLSLALTTRYEEHHAERTGRIPTKRNSL